MLSWRDLYLDVALARYLLTLTLADNKQTKKQSIYPIYLRSSRTSQMHG